MKVELIYHFVKFVIKFATLKNNLEFFSSSKTADKLIKEVEQKIEMAEKELEKLIEENNK